MTSDNSTDQCATAATWLPVHVLRKAGGCVTGLPGLPVGVSGLGPVAKSVVTMNPLLPKTKTPFKINLLIRTKTLPSRLLFSLENDDFTFVN